MPPKRAQKKRKTRRRSRTIYGHGKVWNSFKSLWKGVKAYKKSKDYAKWKRQNKIRKALGFGVPFM